MSADLSDIENGYGTIGSTPQCLPPYIVDDAQRDDEMRSTTETLIEEDEPIHGWNRAPWSTRFISALATGLFELINVLEGPVLATRSKVEFCLRRLIQVCKTSSWVMTYVADLGKEALWFLSFDDV